MAIIDVERHIAAAEAEYTDELQYHNWDHAVKVMGEAIAIAERVRQRQAIEIDIDAIRVAAAWHDAGYGRNHRQEGFSTKEHYSAYLAGSQLAGDDYDEQFVRRVRGAILGTIEGVSRDDIHALILHRADVANVGGDYELFRTQNAALYREVGSIAWNLWTSRTGLLASKLADESVAELTRLGEPVGTEDAFDTRARENGARIVLEPRPEETT